MEKRSNGASGGELEDEVEPIVDATAEKRQHVLVPDMSDCSDLRQEILLLPLIRRRFGQPFDGDFVAVA